MFPFYIFIYIFQLKWYIFNVFILKTILILITCIQPNIDRRIQTTDLDIRLGVTEIDSNIDWGLLVGWVCLYDSKLLISKDMHVHKCRGTNRWIGHQI